MLSDAVGIVILLFGFIAACCGKMPDLGKTDGYFIFFVACSLMGAEVTGVPKFYLFELSAVLFLFACFKAVSEFLKTREYLARACVLSGNAMLLVMGINTLVVALHYPDTIDLFASFFTSEKLSWPFQFSGQLGLSLTILFPLCICSRPFSSVQRMLIYVMFVVNTGAVGSRSVFWLALAEILYAEFFMYFSRSVYRNLLKAAMLFLVIGGLIVFLGNEFSFQRSLGQIEEIPLLFDETRVVILRDAVRTWSVWIQGYGLGCFKAFNEMEIHNTPFSLLVETGLGGFVAAMCFLFSIVAAFWQGAKKDNSLLASAIVLSLLAIIYHSMFRNLLTNRTCWFVLSLCYSFKYFQGDKASVDMTGR
ncbi:MAG: hypothetical protein EOM80_01385 [Erysipelotrichia bacterium]|nr:hypothetical protein [Erysipelotrichia bacterium]